MYDSRFIPKLMKLDFSGRTCYKIGPDAKVFRPFSEFILSHFGKLRTGWAEGLRETTRSFC